MSNKYTPGPWLPETGGDAAKAVCVAYPRQGPTGAIIADAKHATASQQADVRHYGGVLICESVDPENFWLLRAAPDLLQACEAVLGATKIRDIKAVVACLPLVLAAVGKAHGCCHECYPHPLHAAGECECCGCVVHEGAPLSRDVA